MAQATTIAKAIEAAADVTVEFVLIETTGDQRLDVPLHTIGGQGVFVKEVQRAVLDGSADIAVHSAKDLPSTPADGLDDRRLQRSSQPVRRARRRPPRPTRTRCDGGQRIGASPCPAGPGPPRPHVRRTAWQHRHPALQDPRRRRHRDGGGRPADPRPHRPHRRDAPARRLRPGGRPGLRGRRVSDRRRPHRRRSSHAVDHAATRHAVEVERAFLAELGSGCSLPVGAHAADGVLHTFLADPERGPRRR